MTKANAEKDKALLIQKMEFFEMQLHENKQQIKDSKKAHEATLKAFEVSNIESQSKNENKFIAEMKNKQQKELSDLENELEKLKKKYTTENEGLVEKNGELELKVKVIEADFAKEKSSLVLQLEQQTEKLERLEVNLKTMDQQKLKLVSDTEERCNKKIYLLEQEIEELKNKLVYEGFF